jgi:hypothetical protein
LNFNKAAKTMMLANVNLESRRDLQESLLNYYGALGSFNDFNNIRAIGMCQNNIGRIYMEIGLFKKAENCFRIASLMAEKEEE